MRGRKAWNLLEEHYGKELTHMLFIGREIKLFAKNGQWYSIKLIFDEIGEHYTFRNLTLGFEFCLEIEGFHNYPVADSVFNLLEHLRIDPNRVNRRSNIIRTEREWQQFGFNLVLSLAPYITVEGKDFSINLNSLPVSF